MLKLPKGLKKKKKGKKSKRKGDDELFTEEELEKYRREHQQPTESGEPSAKNEEWSKFKDLTTGVDSVLRKTQGDLDRIKSTSFFQRVPAGVRPPAPAPPPPPPHQRVAEVTAADFPQLAERADAELDSHSEAPSDDSEDDQDDIFDTSYVDAVERGEVRLACVPDSPDQPDDDLFDTSHLDALIKGQDPKTTKGKKGLDIGIAVSVLTGRIDNVKVTTTKRKRVIPGDLLLESEDAESAPPAAVSEPQEKSILDTDADIPITTPIDLSVSLHTSLIQQNKTPLQEEVCEVPPQEEEDDEFALLAAESLEVSTEVTKFEQKEITVEPVLQESWSVFEADKNSEVFAEGVAEDQLDVVDPYLDQDDPFDTSFADAVVPGAPSAKVQKEAVILEDDDDFDPRAEENRARLNNRRKSSVRIHLTDPSGVRESITSDDLGDKETPISHDLLGGSSTDLTQLGDSPLDPVDVNESEIDPFDTTIVDKIVAPGKVELKLLEQELIGASPAPAPVAPVYRVPSDPDFDPRAEEPAAAGRRASRPENLPCAKSVVFELAASPAPDRARPPKPLTPYYTREVSITEDAAEDAESADGVPDTLTRTRSDEDLAPKFTYQVKRRHSELPQSSQSKAKQKSLLESGHSEIQAKVLTPSEPRQSVSEVDADPFDTSFAGELAPTKTELKLLAKEFSCDEAPEPEGPRDLLDPSDDIFQIKALTPEPTHVSQLPQEESDPFDTSFAGDLQPGRTELKLLESEFLH